MRRLLEAVAFLTRLPIPHSSSPIPYPSSCVYFPLIGGALGALVGFAARCAAPWTGAEIAAWGGIALGVLLTGALHEDGWADTADGLGGSSDPERALALMRDSRIGAFACVALVLLFGFRYLLWVRVGPEAWIGALAIAWAWGRAAPVFLMAWLAPVRPEGLARAFGSGVKLHHAAAAFFLASLVSASCLALHSERFTLNDLFASALGACVTAFLAGLFFRRRLGGITGDCLGAAVVLSETSALLGFVLARRIGG